MTVTVFLTDSEITPSFPENTLTRLKKNYLDIYPWADYLETGTPCLIIKCGLFKYKYPVQAGQPATEKLDETEWCQVEFIATTEFEESNTAYLKACDLEDVYKIK